MVMINAEARANGVGKYGELGDWRKQGNRRDGGDENSALNAVLSTSCFVLSPQKLRVLPS